MSVMITAFDLVVLLAASDILEEFASNVTLTEQS